MGDVMDELQGAEASAFSTIDPPPQEIERNRRKMVEVLLRFAEPIGDDPPTNEPAEVFLPSPKP